MQEAHVYPKVLQALVKDTATEAVKAALAEMNIHDQKAGKSTSKKSQEWRPIEKEIQHIQPRGGEGRERKFHRCQKQRFA